MKNYTTEAFTEAEGCLNVKTDVYAKITTAENETLKFYFPVLDYYDLKCRLSEIEDREKKEIEIKKIYFYHYWMPVRLFVMDKKVIAERLPETVSQSCPPDENGKTDSIWITRFFEDEESADKVCELITTHDFTIQRVRFSTTQGEVAYYVDGKYITNFGDDIILKDGVWKSNTPDERFLLGLFWHPLEGFYHFGRMVENNLHLSKEEWNEWDLLFESRSCRPLPGGTL